MAEYKLKTKKPHPLCLILLISFPSVVAVLISPALPEIAKYYLISEGFAQKLITIFIIGYAAGQLLYSPFANRYGRKIATFIGIAIYLLSCILALVGYYTANFNMILYSRFFMALGSSVGMVISYTIINDYYYPEQARSITGYTMLAYASMPGLAVFVGGFLTSLFSWVACFYFFFIYGFLMIFVTALLPETLMQKNYLALKFRPILSNFCKAFSHTRLLVFSTCSGLNVSFIYIIAGAAPFIGINLIQLSPIVYSIFILIPYSSQILGALFSGKFSHLLSAYRILYVTYTAIIIGSLFMFVTFLSGWINTFSLIFPLCLVMFGIPISSSNMTVMALLEFEDKATGASVMSFIVMLLCLAFMFLLNSMPSGHLMVMPSIFLGIVVLSISFFMFARSKYPDHN